MSAATSRVLRDGKIVTVHSEDLVVGDMVLTDDNFATIVGAVEEGRRIYDNIRKAIQFLLGSNMSEVIGTFAATLLGFTILEPVHLLWINLVTDCFPALALGALVIPIVQIVKLVQRKLAK